MDYINKYGSIAARELAKDGYKLSNYDCGEDWCMFDMYHSNGNHAHILAEAMAGYKCVVKTKINKKLTNITYIPQ